MKKLNVATYLVPSISIEFFEALMVYLERKLKCHTTLRYESRWEGPPNERADIFDDEGVDLGNSQINSDMIFIANIKLL